MAQQLPNRVQSTLSTLLLLLLSLLFAPISFLISLFFSLTHSASHTASNINSNRYSVSRHANGHDLPTLSRRTVLVNGARMQKSLTICRTFARNGWNVVLVEEQGWGNLAATRFSNSVTKFHLIPSSSLPASSTAEKGEHAVTPYIEALVRVALEEKVDLFFPCSGAGSTGADAVAAQILQEKTKGRVRSMIQTPELVEALHEKDRFIALLQRLDMAAPRSEIVFSVDEAIAKLQSDGYPRSILKCAAELDDIGRADMTLYPLLDARTNRPDWDKTRHRLSNLSIPLCVRTPYILQEFIGDRPAAPGARDGGKASEWCTHATVVDGQLTAFVCCPSNDMLMTYYPASHTIVGELALRWTSTFLYRLAKLGATSNRSSVPLSPLTRDTQWNRDTLVGKYAPVEAGITGQFSMDFIYQPATGDTEARLVAIECNPRVHTAICLLVGNPALGEALVPASQAHSLKVTGPSIKEAETMDELSYLSALSLPVMERPPETQLATQADLDALTALPPTWASSRVRFYHAKSLLQKAYVGDATLPQSWIGHDLPARILPAAQLLSAAWVQSIMRLVHPLWSNSEAPVGQVISIPTTAEGKTGVAAYDLAASAPLPPFTDPSFAKDDPWPFFALYHLQWPQLLLWQLVVRGKKWSRINVSTARIFEC
ncbi:hypothetical protein PSEUBRA_002662 [Kalmanozyma brasiliensis GHG001]|uniref:ATP-grasp domain-containing protein n=1 Tax=Kalmanozyma brasiliensis (strain GHG001) TaxID=1365824 RepID=V5GNQ0_KALBG|nr:uncharacterized protein PSEUBRA_002662 [Kalmanozyma brasiliensis GHG001]EST07577.1 hypothetical protein PSEUBRA_002662 [Kalmanozyma brasiliensis GHG001]